MARPSRPASDVSAGVSRKPAPRSALGGGIFVAILPLVGAIYGGTLGQAVIGLLAGLAVGIAIALLLWAFDAWRNRN